MSEHTSEYVAELRELVASAVPGDGGAAGAEAASEVWARLRDLGLHRIGTPEERGGSDGTLHDLLVVVQALAERGVGVPLVECSVADWVIGHARQLDDSFATVALWDGPSAAEEGTGAVTGELVAVPWAREAALLVVSAPGQDVRIVDLRHESVTVTPGENVAGEPRDTVSLAGTPAARVVAGPGHAAVRARLALLWSAAVAGAAHGAYRLTKAYVSERRQFDAPLLRLPAVASGLALMKVQLLQVDAALASAAASGGGSSAVAVARLTTARAATEIGRLAHQLHGAMGITQEYALHHFTRRLWAWRDAVASERDWARELGGVAAELGEVGMWSQLTGVVTGR